MYLILFFILIILGALSTVLFFRDRSIWLYMACAGSFITNSIWILGKAFGE